MPIEPETCYIVLSCVTPDGVYHRHGISLDFETLQSSDTEKQLMTAFKEVKQTFHKNVRKYYDEKEANKTISAEHTIIR